MVRYVLTIGTTAGLLFGATGGARAQGPQAPVATISATGTAGEGAGRALTLEQALALARRANRSLVVEQARVAQAQVSLQQAYNVLFPTLTAQGKYTRNNVGVSFPFVDSKTGQAVTINLQPLNQRDGTLAFSTLLFAPAVYPALKAVKSGVELAEQNMKAAEVEILLSVAQSFYACAAADEVLAARDSNIAVARATLETSRTRFSAGTVTKLDVDRAQIAVLHAEQAKREAELAKAQSYRALATLTETEGAFRVVPPEQTFEQGQVDATGKDLNNVLQLRPEFRALEVGARQIDLVRKADAWKWAPSISAFGNARWFNYDNFIREHHSWAVGATVDWVLYDGGTRDSDRHLQIAKLQETMARQEVLRESIRDDIENGKLQVRT